MARELGLPVALKILSPQVAHKTDVGGVALDLETPSAVREAADALSRRLATLLREFSSRKTNLMAAPMLGRQLA